MRTAVRYRPYCPTVWIARLTARCWSFETHEHTTIQRSFAPLSLVDNNNSLATDVTGRVPREISLDLSGRDAHSHSAGDLEETHRTQDVLRPDKCLEFNYLLTIDSTEDLRLFWTI